MDSACQKYVFKFCLNAMPFSFLPPEFAEDYKDKKLLLQLSIWVVTSKKNKILASLV